MGNSHAMNFVMWVEIVHTSYYIEIFWWKNIVALDICGVLCALGNLDFTETKRNFKFESLILSWVPVSSIRKYQ